MDLLEAVRAGDLARVQSLLDEDPARAATHDEKGVSAVMLALYHRRPEIADALVRANAPVDLFAAAALGQSERLRALLDENPDGVRAFSPDGFGALHLAAFFRQPEAARFLLARGADPNLVAQNGTRIQPLHSAVTAGDLPTVTALLEAGAAVNARQEGGFTPLHSAANGGNLEIVELLLARGADKSLRADDGKSAAEFAQARGHTHLTALL